VDDERPGRSWVAAWRVRLAVTRRALTRWSAPGVVPGRIAYLVALAALAVLTLAMFLVRQQLGVLNLTLLYLLLIFVLALSLGVGPAVLAAILGFLAFDFFFLPPLFTLTINRPDHVLALFVYLGIAITTGVLVARVRARTELALREQRRTALLYDLNSALVRDVTLDQILPTIVARVVEVYGSQACRILLPDEDGNLTVRARFPPTAPDRIDRQSLAMAGEAVARRSPVGLGSTPRIVLPHGARLPRRTWIPRERDVLFLPIAASDRVVGVLEVQGRPGGGRFAAEDERLLASFADQAALAIERVRLTEEATRAAVLAQSDNLKSALLSAVSHDLRTPLAAIKASATALLDNQVDWTPEARAELLAAIDAETDRLTLMVSNLLDLSRIEGGALRPDRDWHDLAELTHDAVTRTCAQTAGHPIRVDLPLDLPLVWLDYVEIGQVLVNLLVNAANYTPAGTPIVVSARRVDGEVVVAVADQGPGIPASRLPYIFDRFYRVDAGRSRSGTGIGLAICKGLVEAHGGTIRAESVVGSGTTITFTLPIAPPKKEQRAS
jgi:two-component system sensor histidine kinase KdpD